MTEHRMTTGREGEAFHPRQSALQDSVSHESWLGKSSSSEGEGRGAVASLSLSAVTACPQPLPRDKLSRIPPSTNSATQSVE